MVDADPDLAAPHADLGRDTASALQRSPEYLDHTAVAVERLQPAQRAQQRGLARSGCAQQRQPLASANLRAVLAKQVDVATNNTEDVAKLEATKPELASQIKVLWTSPLIPSAPFVYRRDLDPAVKAKVKAFVLADDEKTKLLADIDHKLAALGK